MAGLFFRAKLGTTQGGMKVKTLPLPLVVAFVLVLLGWCYWTAIADPVVREADVRFARLARPARAPVRGARCCPTSTSPGGTCRPNGWRASSALVNALRPDLVLIAGDFTSYTRSRPGPLRLRRSGGTAGGPSFAGSARSQCSAITTIGANAGEARGACAASPSGVLD